MKNQERAPGALSTTLFGAQPREGGGVRFRLWAPSEDTVTLELLSARDALDIRPRAMNGSPDGWHEAIVPDAAAGTLYRYRIGPGTGGRRVPDPASRFNPFGVHGPSEVIDPRAYRWSDASWRGLPWQRAVIYELHIGTFTPEGRLDSALAQLPALAALGITAIELMPVAAFSGRRGWGYDGVLPYAVHARYGRPDDLRRFVDTAHGLGMMVLLDVVYNHFGPDGNTLPAWCPEFFNPAHETPWGPAINFDGPHCERVRAFFVANALQWIDDYHLDGLRLDAVHAIRDDSPIDIVAEIAAALQRGPGRERHVHLVLENDDNTASRLARAANGHPLLASAQWNDDIHHAAHVLATGEVDGYYAGYAQQPAALFGRALAEGFVYQGQPSPAHGGRPRGELSAALPSTAFIDFLQTHDQVGNRAFGERLDALAPAGRIEALLACLLLAPAIPMLFMGEEFAATTPFLYFCDFDGELGAAVAAGRAREFAAFAAFGAGTSTGTSEARPLANPNHETTFLASTLRWHERDTPAGQRRLALIRQLLALRHAQLVPQLGHAQRGGTLVVDGESFTVEWTLGALCWVLRANFGGTPALGVPHPEEVCVYAQGADAAVDGRLRLAPDGVHVACRPLHP